MVREVNLCELESIAEKLELLSVMMDDYGNTRIADRLEEWSHDILEIAGEERMLGFVESANGSNVVPMKAETMKDGDYDDS